LGETSVSFLAANNGHVPARDVRAKVELTRKKLPGLEVIAKNIFYVNDMPILQSGPLNVNGSANPFRNFVVPDFSTEDWQMIMNTKQVAFMDTEFSYDNGFSERIQKRYCHFIFFALEQNGKGHRPVEDTCNAFPADWNDLQRQETQQNQ
jgi:hypothetical protein